LPGICSESDRFGVAVAGWIGGYDVGPLHAGWYHNFTIAGFPLQPAGMWYAQTIRLSNGDSTSDRACPTCPTWQTLQSVAQANPGSLWLIGNEPDRQDGPLDAERYAQLYHEFYTFLKAADPTCLVGIGGVVQPTSIRLEYLDKILAAYRDQNNGAAMPVDVWNVHHYLLDEDLHGSGAGIPPGTDPSLGIHYLTSEHDMLDPHPTDPRKLGWKGHLVEMRRWMRDRGYRDRPLIISEYGLLMPEEYGYDYERVRDFMLATFDWLTFDWRRTVTDPNLGYPADDNRLVQAWNWYSLNYNEPPLPDLLHPATWHHLFDPHTRIMTALGHDYASYTANLTATYPGLIDLQPIAISHGDPWPEGSSSVTMTVSAHIRNNSTVTAHDVMVRFERDGAPAGQVTVASIGPGQTGTATVTWSNLNRGQRLNVTVSIEPGDGLVECEPRNNRLSQPVLVTDIHTYLPLVTNGYRQR